MIPARTRVTNLNKKQPKPISFEPKYKKGWKLEGDEWRLYINSAHSVSADWVMSQFKKARSDASLSADDVRALMGTDQIADMIFGRVAIRSYLEEEFGYSRSGANNIMGDMPENGLAFDHMRRVPVLRCNSVDAYFDGHHDRVTEAHRAALEKARQAKKREK